jgi:hypothetical protein
MNYRIPIPGFGLHRIPMRSKKKQKKKGWCYDLFTM